MASNKDSIKNTVVVAFLVCLACSIVVSYAAVSLKPIQIANQENEIKKNILAAAGLLDESKSIDEQFEAVETRLVNMETGEFSTELDPDDYDQAKASKDPSMSTKLPATEDIASIKRQEKFSKVYIVEQNGELQTLILPIRGYGLWSTLWGFVALEPDLNTIVGFGFYQHAETPGLGGEVDNPAWKEQWIGKEVYGDQGNVLAGVKKGTVDPSIEREADHLVDGLSGATLTSRGVNNLVHFWLGDDGFKPFLTKLKAGEA